MLNVTSVSAKQQLGPIPFPHEVLIYHPIVYSYHMPLYHVDATKELILQ